MISLLFMLNKNSCTNVFDPHDETGLPEMWYLIWIPSVHLQNIICTNPTVQATTRVTSLLSLLHGLNVPMRLWSQISNKAAKYFSLVLCSIFMYLPYNQSSKKLVSIYSFIRSYSCKKWVESSEHYFNFLHHLLLQKNTVQNLKNQLNQLN